MASAEGKKEGLSLQTLMIASLASAVAAMATRAIWGPGTVLAAALTPVLVAIVSEALRKPAAKVSKVVAVTRTPTGTAIHEEQRSDDEARAPVTAPAEAEPGGERGAEPPAEENYDPVVGPPEEAGPPPAGQPSEVRVYGRGEGGAEAGPKTLRVGRFDLKRVHLKVALATGALAFVVAAAALTLPELLFGSSSDGRGGGTTLFGGGEERASDQREDGDRTTTDGEETTTAPADRTTPEDRPDRPGRTTETQPRTQPETSPTQPQTQPQPQGAPGAPAPPGDTAPSGGETAP